MEIYKNDFTSEKKSDNSPITEADRKSNEIIKNILKESGHAILSEEDVDNKDRLNEKVIWIVDPLDGTLDFINKTGEFTIMIALVENKKPKIGIINCPSKKSIYLAQVGNGAFEFSEGKWDKISVSKVEDLGKCKAIGSRHHLSEKEKEFLKKLEITEFSSIGSSLKACMVSSGHADVYFSTTSKMKEWDTCASYCLVKEAGGMMTDMLGKDLTYNNDTVGHEDGILISNGLVHEEIIKKYE